MIITITIMLAFAVLILFGVLAELIALHEEVIFLTSEISKIKLSVQSIEEEEGAKHDGI